MSLLVITDRFGKRVEVGHGANCVMLVGTVVLTPEQARQLADALYEQAAAAAALDEFRPTPSKLWGGHEAT